MKLNLLPPALIHYTDSLPDGVGGRASGPLVRIRPEYRCDKGIHEHELAHVELFWLTLGLHGLLRLSRRYAIWNEARAYRRQMRYPDCRGHKMTLEQAASRLAFGYRFGLTFEQARLIMHGL